MDLSYDSCNQFLAGLDADLSTSSDNLNSNNSNNNNINSSSSHRTLSTSASPASILDTSFSLDHRNSSSPPGLSSSSATSHSPESLRFDFDASWNPNDSAFFSPIDDPAGILVAQSWDALMPPVNSPPPPPPPQQQRQRQHHQQQPQTVSPPSEYIKIEDDSPIGYFNNQQATISPSNSLLDPTTQTALEGAYSFSKDSDSLFDFNTYSAVGGQPQGNGGGDAYMAWRSQGQQRDDFGAVGWQSPGPQTQQQQTQQQQAQQQQAQQPPQRQQRMSISQEQSPLVNSLSPASSNHSHHTTSSPESRAHDSHSDDNAIPPRPKKRKTSTDEDNEDNAVSTTTTSGRKQQPKKTAHNMIEKRYRTNLNDKIAALRDSVPSLRVMAGTSKLGEDGEDDEDLEGLTPAHKLNKATVLAKATEYIRHLEKRTKRLQDENDQLKNRLAAFEKLATMGSMSNMQPGGGQRGVGGGPGGGLISRLMVGSLAGLMVANGLQENESGSRQLFAVPLTGLDMFSSNQMFWLFFKMVLLFSAVVYVLVPGFFDSKPASEKSGNAPGNTKISPVPSLASSIEIRRAAWLTAVQSVWIPQNSIIMELSALGLKAFKLSLRKLVGWHGYAMFTGMTEDHELARVMAWTIAIDAQLAGGDANINHSRLLLTLLASLTLPATPSRLMLNALHIKVLSWDLRSHIGSSADRLANYYWNEARKAQQSTDATEKLPEHLAQLLELDPSGVMDDEIIQKAYNLAYDRSTSHNCEAHDEGMDTVVEDESIRSPLDAFAAWYSSLIVQSVLATSLKTVERQKHISEELQVALRVAPPNSNARLRTLVAKAILDSDGEGKDLRMALTSFEDLRAPNSTSAGVPRISGPSVVAITKTDIRIAIRCAMALNLLSNGSCEGATCLFSDFDWRRQTSSSSDIGLLGFVAIWKTLNAFVSSDDNWVKEAGESVDRVAAVLRIWIGSRKMRSPSRMWIGKNDCKRVIDFCNGLQRRLAGLCEEGGSDDGYVSGGGAAERAKKGEVKVKFEVPETASAV